MKLISMTDFVLEKSKEDFGEYPTFDFKKVVTNYAHFLKQPLTLGIFVPCDENGKILEKPKNYDVWEKMHLTEGSTIGFSEHERYFEVKERVLFKGFEVKKDICYNGEKRFTLDYGIFIPTMNRLKIEDLIYNKKNPIELTESARKQIGL